MNKQIDSNIREIDTVNWHVVERIMCALYENGEQKKSQITSRSGINYVSCMRYLKWLETKMGFVEFELGTDLKQIKSIRLSSDGILFCKKRILINENINSLENLQYFLSI